MKISLCLCLVLALVPAVFAEAFHISNPAVLLTDQITDSATREILSRRFPPLSPETESLPSCLGLRLHPSVLARDEATAAILVKNTIDTINRIVFETAFIGDAVVRVQAQKKLAIVVGLANETQWSRLTAALDLVGFHQHDLSLYVVTQLPETITGFDEVSCGGGKLVERRLSDQVRPTDVSWLVELICRQMNELDKLKYMQVVDHDDRVTPMIAKALCAAIGVRYSSPMLGWSVERLRRFTIKQLERAANRQDLSPGKKGVIKVALRQVIDFRLDPNNRVVL